VIFEPWYQSELTENEYIISSRVRLARNLQNHMFMRKLSTDTAFATVREVENTIGKINHDRATNPLVAQDLRHIDEHVFLEKHVLSPAYVKSDLSKGVFVDMHQNISIMVNEEDHVRLQVVCPGNNLPQALTKATELDDVLEEHLDFAFDSNLGYLTACPTNVGTGLRASFMIHLPCLEKTGMLKGLFPYIARKGMTLRGLYGEGTIPMGNIFQLSNQVTLGKGEAQVVKELSAVAAHIISQERQVMDKINEQRPYYLQDKTSRAYGNLSYGRKMGLHEAMGFLSDIRLGIVADFYDLPKPDAPIYNIMMEIQPGHLQQAADDKLTEHEIHFARADYLRKIFN